MFLELEIERANYETQRRARRDAMEMWHEAESLWPNFNEPRVRKRMMELLSDPGRTFLQAYAQAEQEFSERNHASRIG